LAGEPKLQLAQLTAAEGAFVKIQAACFRRIRPIAPHDPDLGKPARFAAAGFFVRMAERLIHLLRHASWLDAV
jgi:hypothetical protein